MLKAQHPGTINHNKTYYNGKAFEKRKLAEAKIDKNKHYNLKDASALVKEINTAKFDASVDLHIRLGVDPTRADQQVRGTVSLPHGTGKTKKVLVLCTPDKEEAAKNAGADFVGLDEFVQKIEGGWTDVDVIIATPSVMPKIGCLGKILGPRIRAGALRLRKFRTGIVGQQRVPRKTAANLTGQVKSFRHRPRDRTDRPDRAARPALRPSLRPVGHRRPPLRLSRSPSPLAIVAGPIAVAPNLLLDLVDRLVRSNT